tara:strand:- start:2234 stop:2788 length:555 start_codon:yes stop_codon:yes gene_type:complete
MKLINLIIFFLISIFFIDQAYSNENIISHLKEGNKIIFIRHALAPGSGDPENINLNDCKTQRNLNIKGINQSKKIGNFFKNNNIKFVKVLSSEWCRCKDTALHAFSKYKTFSALNSFYDQKFYKNKNKQIKELKSFIKKWNKNENLILVTHYVVIMELLGVSSNSGEVIVSNKKYEVLSRININ